MRRTWWTKNMLVLSSLFWDKTGTQHMWDDEFLALLVFSHTIQAFSPMLFNCVRLSFTGKPRVKLVSCVAYNLVDPWQEQEVDRAILKKRRLKENESGPGGARNVLAEQMELRIPVHYDVACNLHSNDETAVRAPVTWPWLLLQTASRHSWPLSPSLQRGRCTSALFFST